MRRIISIAAAVAISGIMGTGVGLASAASAAPAVSPPPPPWVHWQRAPARDNGSPCIYIWPGKHYSQVIACRDGEMYLS